MDSTSPQKVVFTIYLNIEYSLCNSVGETFLLHLVLAGEGDRAVYFGESKWPKVTYQKFCVEGIRKELWKV